MVNRSNPKWLEYTEHIYKNSNDQLAALFDDNIKPVKIRKVKIKLKPMDIVMNSMWADMEKEEARKEFEYNKKRRGL